MKKMMREFSVDHQSRKNDEVIIKGPWKAEEDAILLNHVSKCGPRDWSSLRSKGVLRRTGKSCRLRWVNKLRPNLKSGCKFSLEEERVVIELQAQFGNKWAKIATFLQGRTDNDVKNFWSSRQKRLARILQSPNSQRSKSYNLQRDIMKVKQSPDVFRFSLVDQAPQALSALNEPSSSSSSNHIESAEPTIKMGPMPDFGNPGDPDIFAPLDDYIFPLVQLPPPEFQFSAQTQELAAQFEDPNFVDVYGPGDHDYEFATRRDLACFDPIDMKHDARDGEGMGNPMAGPESFLDELPPNMFCQIEPLPSFPEW